MIRDRKKINQNKNDNKYRIALNNFMEFPENKISSAAHLKHKIFLILRLTIL